MDFNPGQINNSEYCFNFNNGLKEVLTFYKNFLFESKKEEIELIENLTKKSDYYEYLSDYEIAKEMNKRFPIIKYLNKYKLNTEKEINKAVKEWEILEKKIKNKDISNIGEDPTSYNYEENEDINYLLNKYFRDKNNEQILLHIFTKDTIDYYKENNRYMDIFNKYLKEILIYYKDYFYESKKEEIITIEKLIKDKKGDYQQYLRDYEEAVKMNKRTPIIRLLFIYYYKGNERTELTFHHMSENFLNWEKQIKDKRIKKMKKDIKPILFELFSNINNKEILLKIFEQEDIDFFLQANKQYNKQYNPQYLYEELLTYYKEFLFESKKKDILLIQENLINKRTFNNEYLEDYNIAKIMNKKIPIINYLFSIKNKGTIKTEKDFQKIVNLWEEIELMIKKKDIKNISQEYKEILNIYFNDEKNKELLLKILSLDEYNYFINETNKEMI